MRPIPGYCPHGYKSTEAGVIPEDWQLVPLGSVITEFRGGAPLKPSDFTLTGVKVLPKGGVGRTGWLHVSEADLQYCSAEYARGHGRNQVDGTYTIVVLRDLVPSGPSIGLMVRIKNLETYVLAQGVYGFKVNSFAIPGYLVQLSNTRWYRKLANLIMVGSTQVHITNTAFKRAQVPLPPPIEQEAIAEALSDADALIESLEQLLAKKRQVKQGAMQELLTGKKRLSGFEVKPGYKQAEVGFIPEDWHLRQLGNAATFLDGKRRPVKDGDRAKMRGTIPYYGASGIVDYVNDYLFDEDLILLGEDGENILSRNCRLAFRISGKAWVNNHAHVLKPNPDVSIGFLTEYLESLNYEQFNSGTAQPKLNKQTCFGILIALPPTKAEQEAIASILSGMDIEIATLEAKLAKARQLKQGMMQELLTGKTRLVDSGKLIVKNEGKEL